MSDEVNLKDLEKEVLSWLGHRNSGWAWFFGGEKLDRDETIRRFKSNKKFRKMVLTLAIKKAIDGFKAGSM